MRRFLGTTLADEFPYIEPTVVEREWLHGVEMVHTLNVRLLTRVLKERPHLPVRPLVLPQKKNPRIELVTTKRKVS